MNEKPKVVFSTTLTDPKWAETRVAQDVADEIARLKQDDTDGDILAHAGASFVRSLADCGLVDEYHLCVRPVVLGDGLPLFTERLELELLDSRAFPAGAVLNVYVPRR